MLWNVNTSCSQLCISKHSSSSMALRIQASRFSPGNHECRKSPASVLLAPTKKSFVQIRCSSAPSAALEARKSETAETVYRGKFQIRSSDVNYAKNASIEALASLLREVSLDQAISCGFDTNGYGTLFSMRKHNLIWVLTRMHIDIVEYPRWKDNVEIETWFQFEGKIATRRNWVVKDVKTGNVLANATSTWVMLNEVTRRLSKLNDEVQSELGKYALDPPRSLSIQEKKSIARLNAYDYSRANLKPGRNDMDMNQHVANMSYISWMLESLPAQVFKNNELASITLEFKQECHQDNEVTSLCSSSPQENPTLQDFTHLIKLSASDKEVCLGHSTWRNRAYRMV